MSDKTINQHVPVVYLWLGVTISFVLGLVAGVCGGILSGLFGLVSRSAG